MFTKNIPLPISARKCGSIMMVGSENQTGSFSTIKLPFGFGPALTVVTHFPARHLPRVPVLTTTIFARDGLWHR
jgi:hypothetical protein